MKIKGKGLTDQGVIRQNNEDFFFVDNDLGLYIVCDGVGGSRSGEVASKLAAETCTELIKRNKHIIDEYFCVGNSDSLVLTLIQTAILEACKIVHNEGLKKAECKGMSTTMTALLTLNSRAVLGHVGDSRLYLVRNNEVHQVTEDHTLGSEMRERYAMSQTAITANKFDSVLSRSIGHHESVEVDTLIFDMLPGDQMVLCSDGFHNYLRDAVELIPMIKHDRVETSLKTMIEFAIHRGGRDNITTILIETSLEETIYQNFDEDKTEILNNLSLLTNIYLFKNLNFIRLNRILAKCEIYEVPSGEIICEAGVNPEGVLIIPKKKMGKFKNSKNAITLDN
jgi:PPM family protein phosphatase